MGGSVDRTADVGAFFGVNVDCVVVDRFLSLYLVALYFYVELGRFG